MPFSPIWIFWQLSSDKEMEFQNLCTRVHFKKRLHGSICRVINARGNDPGTLLALLTCGIPCLFVMIPGGFVDNRIFCRAVRAGEPNNIPASGSGNFRFYRVLYHCFKDCWLGVLSGWNTNLISCSIHVDKKKVLQSMRNDWIQLG